MFEELLLILSIDIVYVVIFYMYSDIKICIIVMEFFIIFYNCIYKFISKLYNCLEYVDIVILSNELCYIELGKLIMVVSFGLFFLFENVGELLMLVVFGINYY